MRLEILLIIPLVCLGFLIPQLTQQVTGTEQMTLKAQLKPSSNQFLKDYFDVKKFGFVASNGSEICPQNNCKYTIEGGQFSQSGGTNSFQGKLKVTSQEEDVKKSKFYNFIVLLDKTGEQESNGKTIQTFGGYLGGGFGLGANMFSPEIKYDITNATLVVDDKNPVLTIQGQR